MILVGVDVGGTFTDLVLAEPDGTRLAIHKVSTTPEDPSDGVIETILGVCERAGIASIAICFLFSYLDPMHERRARALVLEEHAEAFVTLCSDAAPQFREFERFTTAAVISDRPVVTMLSGPPPACWVGSGRVDCRGGAT